MGFDAYQEAAHIGQARDHAGGWIKPASAGPQEGQRRQQRGDRRRKTGRKLARAEASKGRGHRPVHQHRLVHSQRVVVHRHNPIACVQHGLRDRGESRLVLIPKWGCRKA